jgi:hypothetical protein
MAKQGFVTQVSLQKIFVFGKTKTKQKKRRI